MLRPLPPAIFQNLKHKYCWLHFRTQILPVAFWTTDTPVISHGINLPATFQSTMSSANSCTPPPPHPALKLLRHIYNFCSACTPLPLKCVANVAVYASTPFSLYVTFQDTGHRYCQLHSWTLILPATFQATDIPQWHPKAPILLAAFQSTASMATLVLAALFHLPCPALKLLRNIWRSCYSYISYH